MSDDNPYRFVDAVETEESADLPAADGEPGEAIWDLRAYVAPGEEPIFSPAEIAELGSQWPWIAVSTFVDLTIIGLAAGAAVFSFLAGATGEAAFHLLFYSSMAVVGMRMLLWADAYLLLRALRYARGRSALAATLYAVPVANLSLLSPLKAEAVAILKRHGIPTGVWGVPVDSLPRKVEPAKNRRT